MSFSQPDVLKAQTTHGHSLGRPSDVEVDQRPSRAAAVVFVSWDFNLSKTIGLQAVLEKTSLQITLLSMSFKFGKTKTHTHTVSWL